MNYKKILLIMLATLIVLALGAFIFKSGESRKKDTNKMQVVASNFASYDFARAIIGDNSNVELTFLMGPGKDSHSYEPTAQDLVTIQNADLFIYVGGEMEQWADKVLESLDNKNMKIICIADSVDIIEEKEVDGAEEEHNHNEEDREDGDHNYEHHGGAYDEHIWTSPSNAIKMVTTIEKAIEEIDERNAQMYKTNADNYIEKIKEVDIKIQEIVDNRVRNRLIFADKMPMQYFIDYYGLEVSAAFSGCSTDTEPSAKTMAYLINKVKNEKIPVVLYIELNPGTVANAVAKEAGNTCETMQIQTLHNVSLEDFNNGETWVSLMTKNLEVLKKALL